MGNIGHIGIIEDNSTATSSAGSRQMYGELHRIGHSVVLMHSEASLIYKSRQAYHRLRQIGNAAILLHNRHVITCT